MDDFDLPDDLKDAVEVIYLDDDHEIEEDEMEEIYSADENVEEAEVIDLSKASFTKHQGSVFCCDLSKCGQFAVTGGEDDMAYVWSTTTLEVVFECTGHKDSVTEVCFNHDDQYVATGDMSGLIQVWNLKEKKLEWCYEGDDLEWLFWHPFANVLVSGSQSGAVYIWQIPQGRCKVLPSHGFSASCGKMLSDGKRLVIGYGDGQLKLWDVKTAQVQWQVQEVQENGITALDVNSDDSLIVIAPMPKIFKVADGKLVSSISENEQTDVEAVTFNSNLGFVLTGALSGQLCVWDCSKNVVRHRAKIESSVTLLKWGLNEKLFVGAADGAIYVCDVKSGTLIETLTGHKSDIYGMAVSRSGDCLLSVSDDGSAKLFTVKPD